MKPGASLAGPSRVLLLPSGLDPTKLEDHQNLRDLVASASSSRLTDHPHLPLRAWVASSVTTPVPFPHPLGLPASRLQDSGLLKMEKSTLSTSFTLILQTLPSTALLSSLHPFILLFHSPFLSCLWASLGLGPLPQYCSSHGLPPRSQPISGLWFWGPSWMISHFYPRINKPYSCPFTPNSRDCYFKITLQACPKQSHFVCQGSHRTVFCPINTTIHTRRPTGPGPL